MYIETLAPQQRDHQGQCWLTGRHAGRYAVYVTVSCMLSSLESCILQGKPRCWWQRLCEAGWGLLLCCMQPVHAAGGWWWWEGRCLTAPINHPAWSPSLRLIMPVHASCQRLKAPPCTPTYQDPDSRCICTPTRQAHAVAPKLRHRHLPTYVVLLTSPSCGPPCTTPQCRQPSGGLGSAHAGPSSHRGLGKQ
jgi:hypothetical protein